MNKKRRFKAKRKRAIIRSLRYLKIGLTYSRAYVKSWLEDELPPF